jgi:FKBP-type peptidyl-prolyl cis-trans isomerase FklB
MKSIKLLFGLALLLGTLASCSESEEVSEFDRWETRNVLYVDSIAKVARENADGNWKVFLAAGLDDKKEWSNDYYVYCKVLQAGDGTESPMYTDTVLVNYSGRLMPTSSYSEGYQFDASYYGELDPSFDVPVKLSLSNTVEGFSTALQHMVAGTTRTNGDIWRIYIPYTLGYGTSNSSTIPAYSTLIFDVNLVGFTPAGVPFN